MVVDVYFLAHQDSLLNRKCYACGSTSHASVYVFIYVAVLDIEFEYYSVVYFECITELCYTFDAKLPLGAARAHTHFLDVSDIHAFT